MRCWILGEEEDLEMIACVCCVDGIQMGLDMRCFTVTFILVLFVVFLYTHRGLEMHDGVGCLWYD